MEGTLIQIDELIHINVRTSPNDVVCGRGYFEKTSIRRFIWFIATMIDDIIYIHYKFSNSYQRIVEHYELLVNDLQNNVLSLTSLPPVVIIRFMIRFEPLMLHNQNYIHNDIHGYKYTGLPNALFQYLEDVFSDKNYVLK